MFKNNTAVCILHKICNICFNSRIIPSLWSKGIITPIPKCSTSDHANPLSYRGITLAPSAYKVYCGVINDRLSDWVDDKGLMCEEQNGFRKGRSTVDHLSTLTCIIETPNLKTLSTFAAFIDFRKAYDKINRSILLNKLEKKNVRTQLSIYSRLQCCVKLNNFYTDWSDVNAGLKQGCKLYPLLFSLFINDLNEERKKLNIGIQISD